MTPIGWTLAAIGWLASLAALVILCRKTPKRAFKTDRGPEIIFVGVGAIVATSLVGLIDLVVADIAAALGAPVDWSSLFFARNAATAVIGIALIWAARRLARDDFLGLHSGPRAHAIMLGVVAWAFTLPLNIGVHAWNRDLLDDPDVLQDSMSAFLGLIDEGQASLYVPMIIVLILVVPMIEELVFRGWLQTGLRTALEDTLGARAARVIGLAMATALFTGVHPPYTWPPVAMLGLILGVLYERTGCLWACVTFHGLHNGFTLYYAVTSS